MKINKNYANLNESYLFSTIASKVRAYEAEHSEQKVIRLGIGDVTRPISPSIIKAMETAVQEMGVSETFRGYGPEQGYDFLRKAIQADYQKQGIALEDTEIFVSDGAKSDLGNMLDLFDKDNIVLIPTPVYPVYVDTNIMDGREIVYIEGTKENHFLPLPDPNQKADIIYLCSPNNPTGGVYTKEQLKQWVDYALAQEAVILFDSAYMYFIQDETLPKSIYEIEGAKQCAIEVCSYSKTAGFTGVRCGYTIVPHDLVSEETALNAMWLRRQTTKFNGVSYVVQRAAEAIYTEASQKEIKETIAYYMNNATIIKETFEALGIYFIGAENSPYVWFECPNNMDSWTFFDELLIQTQVVGTPGEGFGKAGDNYFRLTAFNTEENTREAMRRIREWLGK